MPQKRTATYRQAPKKKKRTSDTFRPKRAQKRLVPASSRILENGTIEMVVPLITISEANTYEHWTKSAARHKKQKGIIKLYWMQIRNMVPPLPIKMQLIRLAPRKLDFVNLCMSMKWIEDSICEELTGNYVPGRADGDPRIKTSFSQEKSKEYGVKIIFEPEGNHEQIRTC